MRTNADGNKEGFWSGALKLPKPLTPTRLAKSVRRKMRSEHRRCFGSNFSYTPGDVEEILNEIAAAIERLA